MLAPMELNNEIIIHVEQEGPRHAVLRVDLLRLESRDKEGCSTVIASKVWSFYQPLPPCAPWPQISSLVLGEVLRYRGSAKTLCHPIQRPIDIAPFHSASLTAES